jgi:hypothetical protein
MKSNKIASATMFIVGLAIYLLVAYGLDRVQDRLIFLSNSLRQSPSFKLVPFLPLFYPLAILIIVTIALLAFLSLKNKLQNERWIGILYLIIGTFIIFAYNLSLAGLLPEYVRGIYTPTSDMVPSFFSPQSYLYVASGLVIAFGVLLIRTQQDK